MSPSLQQSASRSLIVTGVLSIGIGLFTVVYPPVGEATVWGYPFPPTVHVAVAVALVVAHLLKAHGFVGLSRLEGATPVVRWSMLVAALGFVLLAICEGVSATMAGVPLSTPAAVRLNDGYGAGSMLEAIPSVIGGAVVVRRRLLEGSGRWSVLLSGVFMIVVVTPALIMGRGALAYLALTAWSAFYLWIGRALARTSGNASLSR